MKAEERRKKKLKKGKIEGVLVQKRPWRFIKKIRKGKYNKRDWEKEKNKQIKKANNQE